MARKNLDDFLSEFGNPGKCQIFYGVIIIFITMQWTMIQQFNVVMSYVPDHLCKTSLNNSEKFSYSTEDACVINFRTLNQKEGTIPCPNGWVYETLRGEIYPSNEFDLVCDREYLFRLALTVPYIGVMLGSLVFGFLSDKYGRKKILVFILPTLSAFTIGCSFSPNLTVFIIIRFFSGFFAQAVQTITATYSSELFRRKTRTIVSCINAFMSAVTLPVQMYMMYFLLNWRIIMFIQGALLAISIVSSWFLPESVTWLISKNKLEKSEIILKKFAKVNKLPIPKTLTEDLNEQTQEFNHKNSKSSIRNYKILFCHSSLTRVTLSIMYMMFVNNLVNSGLSFSISSLDGNVYTNYLTNSILQLIILSIFLALFNRFGRIRIFILLFISSGLLCGGGYILIFYSKNWHQAIQTIGLFMALVSRNLTSASTAMLPTYASELLPTFLRSTGIGLGFVASRLGSTLTPQILYTLNHVWEPLPQTLYGVLMLIAVIVIWFLPETFSKFMPRTLEDVDKLMSKSRDEEKQPLLEEKNSFSEKSFDYKSCESDHTLAKYKNIL